MTSTAAAAAAELAVSDRLYEAIAAFTACHPKCKAALDEMHRCQEATRKAVVARLFEDDPNKKGLPPLSSEKEPQKASDPPMIVESTLPSGVLERLRDHAIRDRSADHAALCAIAHAFADEVRRAAAVAKADNKEHKITVVEEDLNHLPQSAIQAKYGQLWSSADHTIVFVGAMVKMLALWRRLILAGQQWMLVRPTDGSADNCYLLMDLELFKLYRRRCGNPACKEPFGRGGNNKGDDGDAKQHKSTRLCVGCQEVAYCGKPCQQAHRKQHKRECDPSIIKVADVVHVVACRLYPCMRFGYNKNMRLEIQPKSETLLAEDTAAVLAARDRVVALVKKNSSCARQTRA